MSRLKDNLTLLKSNKSSGSNSLQHVQKNDLQSYKRLVIENVTFRMNTNDALKKALLEFGELEDFKIYSNGNNIYTTTFAVAVFKNEESCTEASIKLSNKIIAGRKIDCRVGLPRGPCVSVESVVSKSWSNNDYSVPSGANNSENDDDEALNQFW